MNTLYNGRIYWILGKMFAVDKKEIGILWRGIILVKRKFRLDFYLRPQNTKNFASIATSFPNM